MESETEGFSLCFAACVLRCKSSPLEAILQLGLQDTFCFLGTWLAKGGIACELFPHLMSLSEWSEVFALLVSKDLLKVSIPIPDLVLTTVPVTSHLDVSSS